jgi:hypothetical protein
MDKQQRTKKKQLEPFSSAAPGGVIAKFIWKVGLDHEEEESDSPCDPTNHMNPFALSPPAKSHQKLLDFY